jgi:hypothetical protein
MNRIKFLKKGQQRKFLRGVLKKINCPSLRSLKERGFEIPYSTLRNYYSEERLLPEELFKNLCAISKIDFSLLNYEIMQKNWGQIKGGRKSKK